MIKKSNQIKFLTLTVLAICFILGNTYEVNAQSNDDPFRKPNWDKPKGTPTASTGNPGSGDAPKVKQGPPPVVPVAAPAIQARIDYFLELRRKAAENGDPIPKATSVLTLKEMTVTGIFKTPRGYAAMVQADPINLSYTVYPGEKFFDGQLVAVEENRLVFRKVVKMSDGKFVTSEESKVLREYTQEEGIQGTAPLDTAATRTEATKTEEATTTPVSQGQQPTDVAKPTVVVSPLEEMNKQPVEVPKSAKEKPTTKKGKPSAAKKTTKIANNKKQ